MTGAKFQSRKTTNLIFILMKGHASTINNTLLNLGYIEVANFIGGGNHLVHYVL
jgi:hypothetical protein